MNRRISKHAIFFLSKGFISALLIMSMSVVSANAQERSGGNTEKETDLPRFNIKTNLLYDLTTTLNLGFEFRINERFSLDVPFNYNPFQFSNNRKWKHFLAQPEFRWWFGKGTFRGHFAGIHAHYAYYNIGNLPSGPFSQYMRDHRFEGDAYGAGISYGYRWNFSYRWGLEATIGVGYAYKDYEVFECQTCGHFIDSKQKHYFGPTKVGVSLIFGIGNTEPAPVLVAQPVVYYPNLSTSYVIPDVESPKVRSQTHTAYLDFEQGRSEIIANMRNNAAELNRINDLTRGVSEDAGSTISRITVIGHASPEDTYERNMILSQRRSQAVGDYVNGIHKLDPMLFHIAGQGEDWNTLDSLVSASTLSDKSQVLEIIRRRGDADERESILKRLSGGATYRRIFNEFYPALRRTDYRVDYIVVPFSVEEAKVVFRTHPQNLSLNEMYRIANTYEPGGSSFNEVFEAAVRLFPHSDVANINAAAAALEQRNTAAAAEYLSRVKEQTPAYWNNLGVMQWLQGYKSDAMESFSRAGIQASGNTSEAERHFKSLQQ